MEFPFKKITSIRFGHLSLEEILLFLFWPFASLIFALKQFRSPKAMTFFWLFCIYFGFAFVIPENSPNAADSARYAVAMQTLHDEPISFNQLSDILYSTKGKLDIYEPIVAWLVSIFTGDPRFLFAVFAAVFGYFYSQNLWMIFSRIKLEISWILILMMLTYALINPIWNINGVRMWTASQIFIYGTLRYILYDDKKGLIWTSISMLVHFSFAFPFLLLIIFLFVPKNITVLFAFFWITALINEVNLPEIRQWLSFMPNIFQNKISDYTNEAVAIAKTNSYSSITWHARFAPICFKYATYLWIVIAFWLRHYWAEQNQDFKKLFSFALFFGGFAQVASLIPSGGRFLTISNSLFFAFFILLIDYNYQFLKGMKFLKYLTFPLLLFSVFFSFRIGFDYMGIATIIGNPIITYFNDEQTRLIDFVKQLF